MASELTSRIEAANDTVCVVESYAEGRMGVHIDPNFSAL